MCISGNDSCISHSHVHGAANKFQLLHTDTVIVVLLPGADS